MDDLITEFLTETNESLDELDVDLVNLERNPNDAALLSKIFRVTHTIKGTCGFLGLPRLEKVAHHAENVLGRFRDGDLEVTPGYVTLILESIDRIKQIVSGLEETGAEPQGDDSALIEKLDAVYEGRDEESPASEKTETLPAEVGGNLTQAELDALEEAFQNAEGPAEFTPQNGNGTNGTHNQNTEAPPVPSDPQDTAVKTAEKSVAAQSLRVNVDVLENLMTMVSELVLTRNQLIQILRQNSDSEFSAPLQRLNHVVSDLQEGVMKTRMQPIGNAWSKLPRIIRDLSLELGKKIELEMRGQDTELDRQVLELIKDPLTHMVRNSGDHGIEDPETRHTAGKPETGKIILNAFHEGGHIIIEISDDGKGLSVEKIKQKALQNGLASAEELAEMSDSQIHQFIFNAGLSTAEKVTAVSGRGVGMDVVRTNIEKIGGSIELKSAEGKGSTFTIKIPLTLAIVSALIVESAQERFAIPQLAVRELVMISEKSENRIERIKGAPVFRLRDRLLPLISLSELLKLNNESTEDAVNSERHHYIVVTQVGAHAFGIIVDRVYDTEEIVVKPVAKILRHIELFSGNTILGDGRVIMILDPNGIAKHIGQIDTADMAEARIDEDERAYHQGEKTSLLLFKAGNQTPKAVPLSLVARLENVDTSTIEYSAGQMMVQYRGQLMPLMPFDSSVHVGESGDKPVLVFTDEQRSIGLVVDEIVDIAEEHVDVQLEGQGGLLGSAIINSHATDVVDVGYYLQSNNREWFKTHDDTPYVSEHSNGASQNGHGHARKRILLVDDSSFFRNLLTPLLSVAGYDVVAMDSAKKALQLSERGEEFDVIISDIEMPEMDGFEFAQHIKDDPHWSGTPLLALTSHATPQDMRRGEDLGFSKHIAKFDRDTLLSTLSLMLSEHHGMSGVQNGQAHMGETV